METEGANIRDEAEWDEMSVGRIRGERNVREEDIRNIGITLARIPRPPFSQPIYEQGRECKNPSCPRYEW